MDKDRYVCYFVILVIKLVMLFNFVGLGIWCIICKDSDRRDNDGFLVVVKEGYRVG